MTIKLIDENLCGQPGLSRYIDPQINWDRNPKDYEICIYTDRLCFGELEQNKENYAWIIEPPIINGENYVNIAKNSHKFKKVFSHHINLESQIENFVYVPHGGTWLTGEDIGLHNKTQLVSCIFSNKNWNSFHRMRAAIYEKFKDSSSPSIDFFGSGCNNHIDYKVTGLKYHMFSIVVENSIENDYFTEKLLDCFLTGTIPIYCGTSNVSKYFNSDGIIFFDDIEKLSNIFNEISSSFYQNKKEAVKENFWLAHKYIHPELIINELL